MRSVCVVVDDLTALSGRSSAKRFLGEPPGRALVFTLLLFFIMLLLSIMVILVHFVQNPKFWGDFGAGNEFLGVDLVETIDRRLIFGLGSMCNR